MNLDFAKQDGLVPAIVQDADTRCVLMLGYMDAAALAATLATGRVTFFSRRRRGHWVKGETSGHVLELVDVHADCDRDALLVRARPAGPTCHRGDASCFGDVQPEGVRALERVIADRVRRRPAGSYTTQLVERGTMAVAQKVGEEAVEVALAAVAGDDDQFLGEAADLMYHLLVLLQAKGKSLADVEAVLARRGAAAAERTTG